MPIKPENRELYPADWPAISLAAKERAHWKCQHPGCGAYQYAVGRWVRWGGDDAWEWMPAQGNRHPKTATDRRFDAAGWGETSDGQRWSYGAARAFIAEWTWPEGERPIVIVLTVAHLNHNPADCSPANLAAMCQRHHLAYDQQLHQANARATRRARLAIGDLFEAAS